MHEEGVLFGCFLSPVNHTVDGQIPLVGPVERVSPVLLFPCEEQCARISGIAAKSPMP